MPSPPFATFAVSPRLPRSMPHALYPMHRLCLAAVSCLGICVLLLAISPAGVAAEAVAAKAATSDFRHDIQPILAQRCYRCHGPDEAQAGLRLTSQKGALGELDSGQHAIVPGDIHASTIIARITSDDDSLRMPPEGKPLSSEQVDLLRRWIAEGARWQSHWAFDPIQAIEPPHPSNAAWVRNPIDAFVLDRLEADGLAPAPEANRVALVRRVYYDLTGLPPTPQDVDAFTADTSDDAYERVVDRLLASPRYGERWGRHWLDLVRYADTNSFERDGVKPNAWRFRDYVIRSFNDDKPYDLFIREQLAGDELPNPTPDSLTATAYYRLGLWDDEPADPLQARYDELDDLVATTAQVFLGLTVNCARCHDHKLDPIPQADYYRLLAFFHEIPRYKPLACQSDISSPELAALHREHEARRTALEAKMKPIEQAGIEKMPAEDQRKSEGPERAKVLQEKLQLYLSEDAWRQYEPLQNQFKELAAVQLPPREATLCVGACEEVPPTTFVLSRGNPHVPGEKVEPGFLTALGGGTPRLAATSGTEQHRSGRRTALATWIASAANPLTGRVMVNRIWQYHFGRGLVRTPSNFGSLGTPPTHPELLDWLTTQFSTGGWRLKTLHRLIVTSNTYRMSSAVNAVAMSKDPENNQFWRFDMRRLSAEEIRDSMIAVSGQLNLTMHGPGVFPELSREVLESQSIPGNGWSTSSSEEQNRRSLYIHVKRSLVVPILAEFDFCDTDSSCAARFSTTQPTQALGMLHGDFAQQQATALAARLRREFPDNVPAQVRRGLRLAIGREPDPALIDQGQHLIESLQTQHDVSTERALDYFCLMVLNLNEFVYLD